MRRLEWSSRLLLARPRKSFKWSAEDADVVYLQRKIASMYESTMRREPSRLIFENTRYISDEHVENFLEVLRTAAREGVRRASPAGDVINALDLVEVDIRNLINGGAILTEVVRLFKSSIESIRVDGLTDENANIMRQMPRLKSFTAEAIYIFDHTLQRLIVSCVDFALWPSLTHLTLGDRLRDEHFQILARKISSLQNLRVLVVPSLGLVGPCYARDFVTNLPRLEELYMSSVDADFRAAALRHPRLRILDPDLEATAICSARQSVLALFSPLAREFSPLARFLLQDGDHAIIWRVLEFGRSRRA